MGLRHVLVCLSILGVMVGANVYLGDSLPDQVPVHFNIKGEPDDFMAASRFLYLIPGIYLGSILISWGLIVISPKRFSMPNSRAAMAWILIAVGGLLAPIHLSILLDPTGGAAAQTGMSIGFGFFLILAGNYMSKAERNFFIGIKLPWTLASDDNWSYTHRLAGRLMMLAGPVVILMALLKLPFQYIVVAFAIPMIIPIFASFLYYWRHERGTEAEDRG